MKQTKTANRPRRPARRAARVALAAAVIAVAAALVFKLYLGPLLLQRQVRQALAAVWAGPVRMDDADLNLSGPSRVYGLELADEAGRRWVRVASAKLHLAGWRRLKPELRELELSSVACDLRFSGGRCRPPLRRRPPGTAQPPKLTRLTARPITVRIAPPHDTASAAVYDRLELTLSRSGATYHLALSRNSDRRPGESLQGRATYDPQTGVLDAQVSVTHAADVTETNALFRALGWTRLAAAQGRLTASATYRGPADRPGEAKHSVRLALEKFRLDAPKGLIAEEVSLDLSAADGTGSVRSAGAAAGPGTLTLEETAFTYDLASRRLSAGEVRGLAELTGAASGSRFWEALLGGLAGSGKVHFAGSLACDLARARPLDGSIVRFRTEGLRFLRSGTQAPLLDELRWGSASLTPERLEVTGLLGKSCGGSVAADAGVQGWANPAGQSFRLALTASGLDLTELSQRLEAKPAGKLSGRMDLELTLTGGRFAWPGLAGRGKAAIRGADFWSVPLLASVFGQLRLPHNPATISDLRAVFDVEGPIVRVRRAVVANKLAGIECTGGTVNLQTGDVDVTVVAGTFLTMNRLSKLLLADAKAKVFGRRVQGKWGQIGPKSFSPLPAEKIADSSIRFLANLARSGGAFPKGIIKAIEDLFRAGLPRRRPKPEPP